MTQVLIFIYLTKVDFFLELHDHTTVNIDEYSIQVRYGITPDDAKEYSEIFVGEKEKFDLKNDIKRGNISEAELARKLGISPQNLNNKMKCDNFTEKDLREIATALDCTFLISFKLNDTGEEI